MNSINKYILLFLLLFSVIDTVQANVAIPVVAIVWPQMFLTLFIIMGIEVFTYSKVLGFKRLNIWKPVLMANVITLIIGVPVAAILQVLLESSALLSNLYEVKESMETIPMAMATGLISGILKGGGPYSRLFGLFSAIGCLTITYLLSVVIEGWYLKDKLICAVPRVYKKAVFLAHIYSYLFLVSLSVVLFFSTSIKTEVVRAFLKISRWIYFTF